MGPAASVAGAAKPGSPLPAVDPNYQITLSLSLSLYIYIYICIKLVTY